MAAAVVGLDPRAASPEQYRLLFCEFLQGFCLPQLQRLLATPSKESSDHLSLHVNVQDVIHFDPTLGHLLLRHSALLLPIFDEALLQMQVKLSQHPQLQSPSGVVEVKPKAHIRLTHLPPVDEYCKPSIGAIRSSDFGKLIEVSGTVIRTGMVKMLEVSKEYICQKPRCGYRFRVFADFEQGNVLPQPRVCPAGGEKGCRGTELREVEGSRECSDYQEIKIQDHVQRLAIGKVPRTVNVLLENDLADVCKAGDDVIIVGTLVQRWKPVYRGAKCEVDVFFRAQSIRMCNSHERLQFTNTAHEAFFKRFWSQFYEVHNKPFLARNVILRSVCPQIFGLSLVKLAVLLSLIGGVAHVSETGLRRRGQSHLLLVGDPGTGKSQFLRFAAQLLPRSVLTTGIGSTSAGLTCTAIKDGTDWILEAGALVLADRGLCCIDEFSSIREHDRTSIHEAMEQQTLSVAKAGLVCKLNSRTTLIAATNPKGSYDVTQDLTTNVAIASPLLSRFDLVLVLLDTPNKEWDKKVSTFILRESMDNKPLKSEPTTIQTETAGLDPTLLQNWSVELLRDYIIYVQENLRPVVTPEAERVVTTYYQLQRRNDERNAARTTVRMLESLIRLSQAHARLMFRDRVIVEDAVVAIMASEASLHTSAVLDMGSVLHQDFDADPDKEIRTLVDVIAYKLRLNLSSQSGAAQPLQQPQSSPSGLTSSLYIRPPPVTPTRASAAKPPSPFIPPPAPIALSGGPTAPAPASTTPEAVRMLRGFDTLRDHGLQPAKAAADGSPLRPTKTVSFSSPTAPPPTLSSQPASSKRADAYSAGEKTPTSDHKRPRMKVSLSRSDLDNTHTIVNTQPDEQPRTSFSAIWTAKPTTSSALGLAAALAAVSSSPSPPPHPPLPPPPTAVASVPLQRPPFAAPYSTTTASLKPPPAQTVAAAPEAAKAVPPFDNADDSPIKVVVGHRPSGVPFQSSQAPVSQVQLTDLINDSEDIW